MTTSATAAAVDDRHPWLGLASFSEDTRAFFYGREEEVAELARRVQRKLLTVLFGQSGLRKTSILRAGIVPKLRAQGYCPVYVRIDYGPDAPSAAQQIKQAVLRETAAAGSWTRAGVAVQEESLWKFFHHRDDVLQDAHGKVLMPLLIFDQFEEIFTLAQGDDGGRQRAARFLDGLAELVENRPSPALEAQLEEDDTAIERFDFARSDYQVLITLREDYLAHLESLKGVMPSNGLGRPMEAEAVTDKIWALYAKVPPSSYHALQNLAGYAATMATTYAELGQPAQLAQTRRRFHAYVQIGLKGREANSAKAISLFAEVADLALSDVAGDVGTTQVSLARLLQRGEDLLAQRNGSQTVFYAQVAMSAAQQIRAHLAYADGDYAQAEASSRQALDFLLQADPGDMKESVFRMEHALALARLRRLPEARAQVGLALTVQRGQIADGADDQLLRLELAQSLFVAALCRPTAGMPELKEAARLIAQLPAAIQGYRSARLWRARIADEMRLNTRALPATAPRQVRVRAVVAAQ